MRIGNMLVIPRRKRGCSFNIPRKTKSSLKEPFLNSWPNKSWHTHPHAKMLPSTEIHTISTLPSWLAVANRPVILFTDVFGVWPINTFATASWIPKYLPNKLTSKLFDPFSSNHLYPHSTMATHCITTRLDLNSENLSSSRGTSYQTSSLRSPIPFPPLSFLCPWHFFSGSAAGAHHLLPDWPRAVGISLHHHEQLTARPLYSRFASTTRVHPYRPSQAYWDLSEPSEEDMPCLLLKSTPSVVGPAPHISPQTFSPHLWQMEWTHYSVHLLACLLHWHSRLHSSKMSSLGLQDSILFWFSSRNSLSV